MNQNSIDAHNSVKPAKEAIHSKILKGLTEIHSGTFREIATACNMHPDQVWKRLSELERSGKLQNVSDKRCEISGRTCSVWTLNY